MRRRTDEEIERLLRASRHGAPPADLARRIKDEIPDHLDMGGRALELGRDGRGSALWPSSRPVWLLAASLLLVVGVGFVAIQLIAPVRDLARQIALDGVAVPEPYEIVVPPRWSTTTGPSPGARPAQAWPTSPATARPSPP